MPLMDWYGIVIGDIDIDALGTKAPCGPSSTYLRPFNIFMVIKRIQVDARPQIAARLQKSIGRSLDEMNRTNDLLKPSS